MIRPPKQIVAELQRTGLPWALEPGTKHIHVKVNSKLVGILPIGKKKQGRAMNNVISQIRRAARCSQ